MTFCNSLHRSDVVNFGTQSYGFIDVRSYLHLAFENTLEKHLFPFPYPSSLVKLAVNSTAFLL
jgi:hypothetical protein